MAAAVGIGRFAFTPLLPLMIADGAVTLAGGGALAIANLIGYLAGAISAPFIRMNPRTLIIASLAGGVGATWAMALTDKLTPWLLLRFAAGVAGAWVFVALSSWLIASLDRSGRARASGILFAGVGGGIVLAAAAGTWLLAQDLGWRSGWTTMACIAFAATLLAVVLLPRDTAAPGFVPPFRERRGFTAPHAAFVIVIIAYGVFGFGYIIPATFLPLMTQAHTDNPFAVSAGWLLFGTAATVITLAAGGLRQHVHPRTLWMFSQAAMAVGVILPAIWPSTLAAVATGVIVGAACALTTMTGMWEAQRLSNGNARGLVAVMTSAFAGGQILGPYAGVIAVEASGSFAPALCFAAFALISTALALFIGPRDASH
jgi:predicted MFS family arabinose efflux permease